MAGGLRSVDDEEDPVIVQDLPMRERPAPSQHVAPVGRTEPGIGRYGCFNRIWMNRAVFERTVGLMRPCRSAHGAVLRPGVVEFGREDVAACLSARILDEEV